MSQHASSKKRVLAVDPGRDKCGVAVIETGREPNRFEIKYRRVTPVDQLHAILVRLIEQFSPFVAVVGNGTNSSEIANVVKTATGLDTEFVDEKFSTAAARKRFFEENPPKGWRKLIPVSLQTPSRPYDDYVAVILGERYLVSSNRDSLLHSENDGPT
ncbi:MAG: hypothetical protein N3B12_00445 [Armatimonadetes bacterium]|nr:hypothetical protein [Armatimonadota bacterium]